MLFPNETMPVAVDQFDEPEEMLDLREDPAAQKVFSFLRENPHEGFTADEIQNEIYFEVEDIGTILARLAEYDLVRRHGFFWAVAEDDRVAAYESMLLTSSASVTDDYYADE